MRVSAVRVVNALVCKQGRRWGQCKALASAPALLFAIVRVAHELYSHEGDDGAHHDFDAFELVNVADMPANAAVVSQHHELLLQGFKPIRKL